MSKHKDDYEVGYGKPPKTTQFKKGQVANPNGRPRKSRTRADDDMKAILDEMTTISEGGIVRKTTKRDLLLRTQLARAIKGDARAVAFVERYMQEYLSFGRGKISQAEIDRIVEERVREREDERRARTAEGVARFHETIKQLAERQNENLE